MVCAQLSAVTISAAMESCRCCLSEVPDLFYVFSTLDEFNIKICELIYDCCGILISEHDAYSKNICGSCLKDLTCAARFRERCLKANHILKSKLEYDEGSVQSTCEQLLQPQIIDLVESDEESVVCVDLVEYEEPTTGGRRRRRKSKIKASIKLQIEYHNSESNQRKKLKENGKHTHEDRPFSCNDCDRSFKHKSAMNIHRRVHTSERPYQCSFCDKRFSQNGGLIHHERIHTGERPYRCKVCQKKFIQKGHLNRHSKNKHPST